VKRPVELLEQCLQEERGNAVVLIGEACRMVNFGGWNGEEVVLPGVEEAEYWWMMATLCTVEGIHQRIAMLLGSFWRLNGWLRRYSISAEMTDLSHRLESVMEFHNQIYKLGKSGLGQWWGTIATKYVYQKKGFTR
jgi:hypothetical protein